MPFSVEEYEGRLVAVRERMKTQGLSAIIVVDPANIYYLTGYNAWSFYTPQMLFVPIEGKMLFFAREMDADGGFRTSWLPKDQILGYPERYVQRPHIHPFDWVMFKLRELEYAIPASEGYVGLEMDAHFFSPKAYRAIVHAMPEWSLVENFELVNWVRCIKSDREIQFMRQAGKICTEAMTTALANIEVGMRQCDLASMVSAAQIHGTEEFGGDYPAIVPMMPTGVEADTPHLTWNDRKFQQDQAIVLELSGAYKRYHTPLARTVILGKPSAELDRVGKAADEAMNAVLDEVRPGIVASDLSRTWNWSLAKHGLEKPSRIGYSIGIAYPPDWGERTVSLRSEEDTVLEENMTFHLIGGMWMDGFGYEVSEPIRITQRGVETFTGFPRRLISQGEYS